MKTITEIKKHFSNEEIKLLVEIVRGKQEFDVMEKSDKRFLF
jgi:tmRNA-binding protein